MSYKFLIILVLLILMFIAGLYSYRFLNEKIKSADTGIGILLYAVLLFVALGLLFFGGLFVMIKVYNFLAAPE